MSMNRPTGKREITHEVENFVPDAFVGPSKHILDRPVVPEDHKVATGDVGGKPRLREAIRFLAANESSCRREFATVGIGRDPLVGAE